jgi:Domain of unknown function (DUF4259)
VQDVRGAFGFQAQLVQRRPVRRGHVIPGGPPCIGDVCGAGVRYSVARIVWVECMIRLLGLTEPDPIGRNLVGAWGYGPFENDDALDWVAELGACDDAGFPARALRDLDLRAGLGRREGCAGIAAAEAVAASRGRPFKPLPEQVQEWLAATGARADTRTGDLALRVIDAIGSGDDSELRLLWDEEPDGGAWHEAVDDLRQRLQAPARKAGSRPRASRLRVGLGDVAELTTSVGTFAYIQLVGEPPGGELIRVLPGLFGAPLDDESLAGLVGGESAFLTGGGFKALITKEGGTVRGNFPVPAACAGPQPLRTRLHRKPAPGSWWVAFGGREMPAGEFARLYPDIDQTMLAEQDLYPFSGTLLRMIECEWRPWMHYVLRWMYPEGSKEVVRPKRTPPYPATAIRDKFLVDPE